MERFLVMLAPRFMLFVATASITSGCFDVHTVNPGQWLIDDFEDPNDFPTDRNFERWACRPVDESRQIGNDNCNTRSIDSNHYSVLHLGATLIPSDQDFKRAELITYAKLNQDFTPYAKFWFSWKLLGNLSNGTHLKVQLTCTSVRIANGGATQNPRVNWTMSTPAGVWQNSSGVLLAPTPADGFVPPEDLPTINQKDCLAHVDGIKVTVESGETDTAPTSFDLYVDDISLEPKE
jgi:hypothetical protein